MPQIIEVPGMGQVEFPDGMSDADIAAAIKRSMPQPAQSEPTASKSEGQKWKDAAANVGSAIVRPLAGAIAGPGNMVADFFQAAKYQGSKLLGGNPAPYVPQSQQFQQALDKYTRAPETRAGRLAEMGSTMVAGAAIPMPQLGPKPPPKPIPIRQQVMAQAAEAGYVAPPSSIAPTFWNRTLEGLSGKLKLGMQAQERNQAVTDKLSALALGEKSGAPVTPGAISAIRAQAGQAGYAPLRNIGEITTDAAYQKALDAITAGAKSAERSFPGIKPASPIDDVVASLRQSKFDAGDGLDAISHLRGLADDAYSAGQKALGKQYKSAAKALEDAIERSLSARGKDGEGLLSAFRNARQTIAKTYTASKAAVGDSGQFNAATYGSELAKGAPLTGEQRLIGNFAQSFGRFVRKPNGETVPSVSPLDVYGSAVASGASGSALPFLYPITRAGLREYLLSPAAQQRAIQNAGPQLPQYLGGFGAALPLAQRVPGLFTSE